MRSSGRIKMTVRYTGIPIMLARTSRCLAIARWTWRRLWGAGSPGGQSGFDDAETGDVGDLIKKI